MPGRRGWQDWIPASGEGRALVELKGRVGGKGSNAMRYGTKRRWSRMKSPARAVWVPQNGYSSDFSPYLEGEAQTVPTAMTAMLVINPIGESQIGTGAVQSMRPDAPLLMKFDGKIYLNMPFVGEYDLVQNTDSTVPMLVFWGWRMMQVSAEGNIISPTAMDPFQNGDEGYETMVFRRQGWLRWGTIPIRREWRINPGTDIVTMMAQINPMKTIPFPRLAKRGLALPRNQALCLMMACRGQEPITTALGARLWNKTDMNEINLPVVFPFFRYLINWVR